MPNNVNEYVFCPSCGSITTPGVCTQCGYQLNQERVENTQDTVSYQNLNSTYENQDYMKYEPKNDVAYDNQYEQQMPTPYGNQYGQQQTETPYNNQYGQQPGNMYYNQYSAQSQYNSYQNIPMEPEKKKSRWWIWLLIIAGVLFFGAIIVAVIIAVLFMQFLGVNNTITTTQATTPSAPVVQEIETSEEEEHSEEESITDDGDEYSDAGSSFYAVYAADHTRYDFSDFDWSAYANAADSYSDTTDGAADFYLQDDFSSTFGTNHDNHFGEAFLGDYYDPFVECIDENQDYGLERHFISYIDEKDGVSIFGSIAYMQFTGGTIPNEEELNQKILNATANDLFAFLDGQKTYDVMSSLHFFVDSFVVYNDAEKMSILLDVSVVGDESSYADSYVYAINISTKSGEILDNGQFIAVDEEFAAEFRERCCTQNGTDIEGLNNITNEELAKLLGDEKTNIVFFTPYGLEFGYNYEMGSSEGYSRGWMTITMKDWTDYTETLGEVITLPENNSDSEGASLMNGTTDL